MLSKKLKKERERKAEHELDMKNIEYNNYKYDVKDVELNKKLTSIKEKFEQLHNHNHKKGDDGKFLVTNMTWMAHKREKYIDQLAARKQIEIDE